jgi:hypothetical protein
MERILLGQGRPVIRPKRVDTDGRLSSTEIGIIGIPGSIESKKPAPEF